MLKIAICDDEATTRECVRACLGNYEFERNLDVHCEEFSTGLDFLRDKSHFHVVIMDYYLSSDEEINGLAIAKKLRSVNKDTKIIFLTGHPKIVFSSFEVDTFRFLVKPLDAHELFKALDDVLALEKTDDMSLVVKVDGVKTIVKTSTILCIESMGRNSVIYTEAGEIPITELLSDVEKRLPHNSFFRCHRSYNVNLKFIASYHSLSIKLTDGRLIPVSKSKMKDFEEALAAYSKI